jgi:preprotein translocase subunit SecE
MKKFVQYLRDVRAELAKVSWPSRNEVMSATLLVIALSVAMSVCVYAYDKWLLYVLSFLLPGSVRTPTSLLFFVAATPFVAAGPALYFWNRR